MLNWIWLALVMLYVGMALALGATILYVGRGVRELRAQRDGGPDSDKPELSS